MKTEINYVHEYDLQLELDLFYGITEAILHVAKGEGDDAVANVISRANVLETMLRDTGNSYWADEVRKDLDNFRLQTKALGINDDDI